MTQFAAQAASSFTPSPALPDLVPEAGRAAFTDAHVARNRLATPANTLDKRAVPRASISELNSLDLDQIRDRFAKQRLDSRPALIKAFDLIDLPRNAIANVFASNTARRKSLEGDRAAFDLPRVMFSDVLKEMGVQNRVVRGIAGFAGDVAFDPLTYLGPAGFGLKVAAKGGTTVAIQGAGRKALNRGIRAASKGEGIQNDLVREVVESAGLTPEKIARIRDRGGSSKRIEGAIRRRVLGGRSSSRAAEAVSRVTLGDIDRSGGTLVEGLLRGGLRQVDEAGEVLPGIAQERLKRQQAASAAFVSTFGRGAEKGWTIGSGGSQIAHIPFTDVGIQVPAFTSAGKNALRSLRVARDVESGLALSSRSSREFNIARSMLNTIRTSHDDEFDAAAAIGRQLDDATNAPSGLDEAAVATGASDFARHSLRQVQADPAAQPSYNVGYDRAAFGASSAARLERTEKLVGMMESSMGQIPITNTAEILTARQVLQETTALHDRMRAISGPLKEAAKAYKTNEALSGPERIINVSRKISELTLQDPDLAERTADQLHISVGAARNMSNSIRGSLANTLTNTEQDLVNLAKSVIGVDDDAVGASVLSSMAAFGNQTQTPEMVTRFLSDLDRKVRVATNRRGGYLNELLSAFRNAYGRGSVATAAREATRMNRELFSVMEIHDIPRAELDNVATLLYLQMMRVVDPSRSVFHWTNPDGTPGKMLEALQDAAGKGYFKQTDNGRFMGDLRTMAQEHVSRIGDIGDTEVRDQILRSLLPGYVPLVTTPEADRLMAVQRANHTAGGTGDAIQAIEGFQTARTTHQLRYVDPADVARVAAEIGGSLEDAAKRVPQKRFFKFEEAFRNSNNTMEKSLENTVKRGGEDAADARESLARIAETRETIRRYEKLVKDGEIEVQPFRPTDAFEMNDLVQKKFFRPLTGDGHMPNGFFETNASQVIARRMASHERAVARGNLAGMLDRVGMPFNRERHNLNSANDGVQVTLDNGAKASVIARGDKRILQIGNERFRHINRQIVKDPKNNPIFSAMDSSLDDLMLPEPVADKLEDIALLFKDDGAIDGILSTMQTITGGIKTQLLFHPSWFVFNVIGDTTLALTGGARADHIAKHTTNVAKLRRAMHTDPESLSKITFDVGGEQITGDVMLKQLIDARAFENNATVETMAQIAQARWMRLPSQVDGKRFGMNRIVEDFSTAASSYAKAHPNNPGTVQKNFVAGGTVASDRFMRWIIAPWFKANQAVQDVTRGAAYISHLEQGNAPAVAARKTIESMFDYGEHTALEAKLFKTLIPFYSWIRANLGYQMHMLMQKPAIAAAVPKLQSAIEQTIAGDQTVPSNQRPAWMREAFLTQIGQDPENRFGVILNGSLPQADVFEILQGGMGLDGVQDFMHYMLSATNPILTAGFGVAGGNEFFSGRSIAPSKTEGDMSITQFLLNQFRPLKEFGPGGTVSQAARRSPGEGVSRAILGGRIQSFDANRIETSVLREFKDKEQRIRAAIRRAERLGRGGDREAANLELLLLYKDMRERGFEDGIPKWGRMRLDSLAQPEAV